MTSATTQEYEGETTSTSSSFELRTNVLLGTPGETRCSYRWTDHPATRKRPKLAPREQGRSQRYSLAEHMIPHLQGFHEESDTKSRAWRAPCRDPARALHQLHHTSS